MSKQTAVKVLASGHVVKAEFELGKSYDFLREGVEGWLECVSLGNGIDMWLNEEGKILELPINYNATMLWQASYGYSDVMCGNAILTSSNEDGETVGLSEEQVAYIMGKVSYPEIRFEFVGGE